MHYPKVRSAGMRGQMPPYHLMMVSYRAIKDHVKEDSKIKTASKKAERSYDHSAITFMKL
jgi:hypothetical protein